MENEIIYYSWCCSTQNKPLCCLTIIMTTRKKVESKCSPGQNINHSYFKIQIHIGRIRYFKVNHNSLSSKACDKRYANQSLNFIPGCSYLQPPRWVFWHIRVKFLLSTSDETTLCSSTRWHESAFPVDLVFLSNKKKNNTPSNINPAVSFTIIELILLYESSLLHLCCLSQWNTV